MEAETGDLLRKMLGAWLSDFSTFQFNEHKCAAGEIRTSNL